MIRQKLNQMNSIKLIEKANNLVADFRPVVWKWIGIFLQEQC